MFALSDERKGADRNVVKDQILLQLSIKAAASIEIFLKIPNQVTVLFGNYSNQFHQNSLLLYLLTKRRR